LKISHHQKMHHTQNFVIPRSFCEESAFWFLVKQITDAQNRAAHKTLSFREAFARNLLLIASRNTKQIPRKSDSK